MSYNLIIQDEAILDIQAAFEWYEKVRTGLGFELIEEMENCYQKISSNPSHYTSLSGKFRRIKTNRFPYLIIYGLKEIMCLFIVSCMQNRKKDPYRFYSLFKSPSLVSVTPNLL